MTSPNPMALEAKALEAATRLTREQTFSALTIDEHKILIFDAVAAYVAALPLPAAGEGLTPENSDWIEDAGPVARDGPASHAGEGLEPVAWRYDLENVPRNRHFLIQYDHKEVVEGYYLDNSKTSHPWQGIRPANSIRANRASDKIVAWMEMPGPDPNRAPATPAARSAVLPDLREAVEVALDAYDRSDVPTHFHSHAVLCDAMAALRAALKEKT